MSDETRFKKIFNSEKKSLKDVSERAIDAHIDELQRIALDTKARIMAAQEELRERLAAAKN